MEDDLSPAQPTDHGPAANQDILLAAKGGGILFLGRLFDYASRFVFGIVVARSLGTEGLGQYTLALAVAMILAAVARLGLSEGMVRFLPAAIRDGDEARVWGTLQIGLILPLLVSVMIAAALFGLSNVLAEHLFHDPAAAPILRWISISIPLIAMGRLLMAATRGFKRMDYQVYTDSIAFNIIRLVLTVLFLFVGLGVPGALAAYAVAWFLVDGLALAFVNHLFPLRRPWNAAQRNPRELLSYSAPICLTQVIAQLQGNFGLLLLGVLSSVAAVGIYSAAARVQAIGAMLLAAADLASKPIISDLYHQGDTVELGRLYQTLTRWSTSFILPYFLTMLLFAGPILGIFGQDFQLGAPALVILSVGTLISAATGICSAMILMTGHSKLSLANTLTYVGLSVTLSLILIPTRGLLGAAVATTVSATIVNLGLLFEVRWLLGLWPYNREFFKPAAASLVGLGVTMFVGQLVPADENLLYLLLDIAVLWSAYVATVLLLGLTAEDRIVLSRTRSRLGTALNWH